MTENTKLEDLQKRLTELEAGHTPQQASYKTPPAPVTKPEILSKPEIKKEIPKDTVKKARAEISASSAISPQLMLMAHAVIKIVFKIDKDFSNLTFEKK